MKRAIAFAVALSILSVFSQKSEIKSRHTVGVNFSPGFPSADEIVFMAGLRGIHSFNKFLSAGAEIGYQQIIGKYANSDIFSSVGFVRVNPFRNGFFTEFGAQRQKIVSSARNSTPIVFYPFFSVGYQVSFGKNMQLEMQVRPNTFQSRSKDNLLNSTSQIPVLPFIGLNYSF